MIRLLAAVVTLALAACSDGSGGASGADMLLMGGTAFLSGYTHAGPPTVTCWNYGPMTQCQ